MTEGGGGWIGKVDETMARHFCVAVSRAACTVRVLQLRSAGQPMVVRPVQGTGVLVRTFRRRFLGRADGPSDEAVCSLLGGHDRVSIRLCGRQVGPAHTPQHSDAAPTTVCHTVAVQSTYPGLNPFPAGCGQSASRSSLRVRPWAGANWVSCRREPLAGNREGKKSLVFPSLTRLSAF